MERSARSSLGGAALASVSKRRARGGLRCGAAALLVLSAAASGARASPPEILSALALHPTDPSRLVLAYAGGGQGLLFSEDGGQSLRLRCGAAIGPELTKSRLPLALTHDGQTLLGTYRGLLRGGADGCGFGGEVELAGVQVADLAPHPDDPETLFLAIVEEQGSALLRRDGGGALARLPGLEREDAGSRTLLIDRARVARLAGGGLRFYTSGLREQPDGGHAPVLRRSDDDGASWLELELPEAGDGRVRLLAVDPTDAARLALAADREGAPDALLISLDAGASFRRALELFELGAAAVAPDGRLWVGDAGGDSEYGQPGGLYVLDAFSAPARRIADHPVRCLGFRALDGALLGCRRQDLGAVNLETGAFEPLASLQTVEGFARCGDEDLAARCQAQLCDNHCGLLHYAQVLVDDDELELYRAQERAVGALRDARVLGRGFESTAAGASGALVGMVHDGRVLRWSPSTVLTYCVLRHTFPRDEWYADVVANMGTATAEWEETCGVRFAHQSELDDSGVLASSGRSLHCPSHQRQRRVHRRGLLSE